MHRPTYHSVVNVQPPAAPPTAESKAVFSLVLGILSLTCFGLVAGIPALILGSIARRDIDRSQGRLTGRGMAAFGIVSGLFGTGLSLVLALFALGGALEAARQETTATREVRPELRTASTGNASDPKGAATTPSGTRSYGSLDVVDLDGTRGLEGQLADITKTASGKGRKVVLQTYVKHSKECAQVAAALPDPRMQKALANVTLVRVDIEVFAAELAAMRVETNAVPWFYMLDGTARPLDAINADEWDDNVPENMAPVLGAFVKGSLGARRSPSPVGTAM
ncbi:MAG TPA: DUF4190 domain-containing protein [Labilithrix sp.]|jgi:hypothetical protein